MMKKTFIIAIAILGVSVLANAQKRLPATPFPGNTQVFLESLKHARSMGKEIYVDDTHIAPAPQKAPAMLPEEQAEVGYLNPAGTLFLGMDKAGKGTFIQNPGVIGAWSDTIPCWIWQNQRTAYKSVKYQTWLSYKHPSYCEDSYYAVDAFGNFCDSIVSNGGWAIASSMNVNGDEAVTTPYDYYWWQRATPLQTTKYQDGTEKTYMMLSADANPTATKCPIAAGGLPSGNTDDGLWPLTNAVSTSRAGISMELIHYKAGDGNVHYFFGSSEYAADSVIFSFDENRLHELEGMLIAIQHMDSVLADLQNSSTTSDAYALLAEKYHLDSTQVTAVMTLFIGQLTEESIADIQAEYDDIIENGTRDSIFYIYARPLSLITTYDKPQAPLYIKSVSLAISASGTLAVDTLHLSIQDMNGVELAQSIATSANMSSMSYKKGKLLTFNLQDISAYGELMHEGLLVSDAFRVCITGFQETDNFGIYAAKCTIHPSKTEMLYEGGYVKKLDYEPYIMLNGIYPTLEDYRSGIEEIDLGQVGDTIPVNWVTYHSNGYQYIGSYATLGPDYTQFAYYSTFAPYDTIRRTWNFDVEHPDYIEMVADYELNIGDDDDPMTLWEAYRLFTLYIYAKETPRIGDYIKLGTAGKYVILRFDAINGEMDIDHLKAAAKAEKILQNGQVLIRKNRHVYNTFGQKLQ